MAGVDYTYAVLSGLVDSIYSLLTYLPSYRHIFLCWGLLKKKTKGEHRRGAADSPARWASSYKLAEQTRPIAQYLCPYYRSSEPGGVSSQRQQISDLNKLSSEARGCVSQHSTKPGEPGPSALA